MTKPSQIAFHRIRRVDGTTSIEANVPQGGLHVPAGSVLRLIPVGGCVVAFTLVVEPIADGLIDPPFSPFASPV